MGNIKLGQQNTRAYRGFTIIELLISVSIIAILASVAAPSFASIINKSHITTASTQLSSTLMLSRNHALNTGTTVIVCHAKDRSLSKCSESRKRNTNWSSGIISYADLDGDNTLSDQDQILNVLQNHASVAVVFNQIGRLRFFSDGSARSAGFYLCSKLSEQERHIRILYTGRSRTSAEMGQVQRDTCLSKVVK